MHTPLTRNHSGKRGSAPANREYELSDLPLFRVLWMMPREVMDEVLERAEWHRMDSLQAIIQRQDGGCANE